MAKEYGQNVYITNSKERTWVSGPETGVSLKAQMGAANIC